MIAFSFPLKTFLAAISIYDFHKIKSIRMQFDFNSIQFWAHQLAIWSFLIDLCSYIAMN